MHQPRNWPRGRTESLEHESSVLAGNQWGDPVVRTVKAYLPPGYPDGGPYPSIWYLAAYTNSGLSIDNWRGFGESLPQRMDRLIGEGALGPCVVVAPDCFSWLGGSQYVDSPQVANHASYIHRELIPFVEDVLHVKPGRDHRAVVGKSSGGYGALRFGMEYPDQWGAIASQSGDAHFEALFRGDFAKAATVLGKYDGDIDAFLRAFWSSNAPRGDEFHTLMLICMAASYDPREGRDIRLPFTLDTLEVDQVAWARWLANDPVHMLSEHVAALKSLRGIFIDCGNRDQYNIHFGSRILSREMRRWGIPLEYQEFDGTHSQIDHRLDVSLPFLFQVIQ